jgi:hypothetical protein
VAGVAALALIVGLTAATVAAVGATGVTNDLNVGVATNEPVDPPVQAISDATFCAATEYGASQLSFTVEVDAGGEPIEIDWASDVPLSAVVITFGTDQLTFAYAGGAVAGSVGPAVAGGVLTAEPDSDPCPGTQFGYKFEADDGFGTPEQVN